MRAAVLVLVMLLGCSTDPGAEDPYSLASVNNVCPGPVTGSTACNLAVCDRGAAVDGGRFASLEACAGGATLSGCAFVVRADVNHHPNAMTCRGAGGVVLIRDVDVAAAIRQCQADAGTRPEWCP